MVRFAKFRPAEFCVSLSTLDEEELRLAFINHFSVFDSHDVSFFKLLVSGLGSLQIVHNKPGWLISHLGQGDADLRHVLATPVLVADVTRLIALEEQELTDPHTGVDLHRQ